MPYMFGLNAKKGNKDFIALNFGHNKLFYAIFKNVLYEYIEVIKNNRIVRFSNFCQYMKGELFFFVKAYIS